MQCDFFFQKSQEIYSLFHIILTTQTIYTVYKGTIKYQKLLRQMLLNEKREGSFLIICTIMNNPRT